MATRKGNDDDNTRPPKQGEFRGGGPVRTALIRGETFRAKAVQYVEIDGMAMFEGDIVLGTVEEVEAVSDMLREEASAGVAMAVAISGSQFRWPGCRIPYTIDPGLPNQARVTDAIAHWEANTRFRFVVRTNEADYVTFRPGSGCSAQVGRRGGQQFVNLANTCSLGNTIHEIGHVVGLWHEQSREDRDSFVRIEWANITSGFEHNFNQHISDGDDIGGYDYGSIMHYPRNAFSSNGQDTIVPVGAVPPGTVIGQRNGLSPGDIAAVNSFCPLVTIKEKLKEAPLDTLKEKTKEVPLDTLKEKIKEAPLDTLKEKTKEAPLDTLKELRKDVISDTIKEQIADTRKEGVFDPGPTLAENLTTPGRGAVINPVLPGGVRGAVPFAIATGAGALPGAAGDGGAGDAEIADAVVALDAQLQQLAEELARADAARAALQAQYDETAALLAQIAQSGQG
ncbi:M12 family metallopeptidase [Lysobacter sp. BMK333-48F3]|uniref:Dot/Icm T4SS effector Zinc-dependent metalloprotease LegP n=1 Tax=Lysobacter sp. BMK333-48F3 TaxID=2867962 RepID=UPI001C8CC01A|nr:Dot/Icm T4SS effector Zinc-dependent metalloprotease LegP [Lysobacter sp. BMK333-48F3]MBX9400648.1 M12 family metallopeptidase [Lysobacter sp. BMK333-48F3]